MLFVDVICFCYLFLLFIIDYYYLYLVFYIIILCYSQKLSWPLWQETNASANGTSKDSFFRYTDGNFEEIGIGMEKTLFVGEVTFMSADPGVL